MICSGQSVCLQAPGISTLSGIGATSAQQENGTVTRHPATAGAAPVCPSRRHSEEGVLLGFLKYSLLIWHFERGEAVEILGMIMPFVAAAGWLWWIRHADRFEQERWGLVLKTFALGAAAGLLGLFALVLILILDPNGVSSMSVVLLAPLHVAAIMAVLRYLPYRRPDWNEPFDGIVYGGATGIGYGLVYTLVVLLGDPLLGFRSAVFTIPIYMLAGLIVGYYLSEVRFGTGRSSAQGFMIATLYVGGFELARFWGGDVMGTTHPLASAVVYGANTIGWIMAMWAMDYGTRASRHHPANYRLELAGTGCPSCTAPMVAGAAFCNHCGRALVARQGVQG